MDTLGKLLDLIARNRARVGGGLFVMWLALQANTHYAAWAAGGAVNSVLNDLAVALAGYVWGAGQHKSDKFQRDQQGRP